ncbi:hypothetical protein PGB90_005424 [Kerria lacca]
MNLINNVIVPGEEVTSELKSKNDRKIILGPGLRRVADKVFTCNSGILRKKEPNTYWIDSHRKRYIPQRNEMVIGIIKNKQGDYFKVDIGSSEQALLSYLAFEGATKKNRVKLEIGDLVYAKLLTANRDMEPELVCINAQGKSSVMGVLSNDGYLFHCSIDLVRKMLNPKCPFDKLGKHFPYEITIGMNGRIWIKTHTIKTSIALSKAILTSEFLSFEEIQILCDRLGKQYYNS